MISVKRFSWVVKSLDRRAFVWRIVSFKEDKDSSVIGNIWIVFSITVSDCFISPIWSPISGGTSAFFDLFLLGEEKDRLEMERRPGLLEEVEWLPLDNVLFLARILFGDFISRRGSITSRFSSAIWPDKPLSSWRYVIREIIFYKWNP